VELKERYLKLRDETDWGDLSDMEFFRKVKELRELYERIKKTDEFFEKASKK